MNTNSLRTLSAFVILVLASAVASADPLSGEVIKFLQLPLNGAIAPTGVSPIPPGVSNPQAYPGHDELSTAWQSPAGTTSTFQGNYMADDFSDNFNTPVVHVQWWGSYLSNAAQPPNPAQQFLISFENDVPAGTDPVWGNSHPGVQDFSQIVTAGAQRRALARLRKRKLRPTRTRRNRCFNTTPSWRCHSTSNPASSIG